jgi:D-alanine transaminase
MSASETVYFNGRYMTADEVRISPDDRGFLFADGVYEVIRTYRRRLFRLDQHLARLARSLRELRISYDGLPGLGAVCGELLARNRLSSGEARFYIQITRGAAPRRHAFPPPGTPPTVYARVDGLEPETEQQRDGIRVVLASDNRWGRCDIKSVALLANVLALQRALDQGASEAVFVRDGLVTEGTHSNVFAVVDGVVRTAPLSGTVLPGVTRDVVLEVCRRERVAVEEGPLSDEAFLAAPEAFVTGTTAEITPIVAVGEGRIGDGRPGPVTRRLQAGFRAFVDGPP